MKVFISWSGPVSHEIAKAIHSWLPSALQYVRPYFSPEDVNKGTKWSTEISKELSESRACIIVLTPENLASAWIMFEAGAISTTIDKARVCPLIFDLDPTDLEGPLAQFQATTFVRDDVKRLFHTINRAAEGEKLAEAVADSVFAKWWPDLEAEVKAILQTPKPAKAQNVRSDRELMEEILLISRQMVAEPALQNVKPFDYDTSLYKPLFAFSLKIVRAGDFTDARLEELKEELLMIREDVQSRRFVANARTSILRDLDNLLTAIEQANEIPF